MLPTLGKVPQEGVANTPGKTPVMIRLLPREASSHLSPVHGPKQASLPSYQPGLPAGDHLMGPQCTGPLLE